MKIELDQVHDLCTISRIKGTQSENHTKEHIMETKFKLRNKTARQSACTLKINPVKGFMGWDVVRVYEMDGEERTGYPEFVSAYDISTLRCQFDITHNRAKALSDLFSDLV